jgi:hypothetical protein
VLFDIGQVVFIADEDIVTRAARNATSQTADAPERIGI